MTQQTSNVPVPTTGFGFTGPSLLAEGSVLCKWDNENGWHDRDGSAMPDPVIALGVRRGVRRWQNQELIEEIVDHPLPDCDKLNEAVPQSEWETGLNGEPQEPYKLWHAIYLLNPVDATVFSFLNCTVGISICAGRLESSLRAMQMMRGANAFPVCKLGDAPLKTRFGMKRRPHLEIVEWRTFGGATISAPPTPPKLTHGAGERPATGFDPARVKAGLDAALNDEIPF